MNPIQFFTDPILRGPTIGSMLMCMAAALVGVLVFVRKRSLLGEALSHATYPGVGLAIVLAGIFKLEAFLGPLILSGAFISALLGFLAIEKMEKKLKVSADSALCVILALFFGVGVTIASFAQSSYANLYRQIQSYLYGQAATMTDVHIWIYGILALLVVGFIYLFYKEILAFSFDPHFAQTSGISKKFLNPALFLIVVLALVVGIRCVGVILMSAMLVAPATAARQFTNKLSKMFVLSALFGGASGFFGVYSSVVLSNTIKGSSMVPTGPMIVLTSGLLALYALFFAPKRGYLVRRLRIAKFRAVCIQENLLKTLWRLTDGGKERICYPEISKIQGYSQVYLRSLLFRLIWQKKLQKTGKCYTLTQKGVQSGARIVRLHRLWEVYLVNSLGLNENLVHKNAEEMEHILSPDLEKRLTDLLDNPTQDPHDQPIPSYEEATHLG
ncbi:MAG: Manganese transport system membrane protein MntC [Chlamydiales bacterium]|nr:Manganese transport system membrane protein MntC [Chlamydiales bacterium]